MFGYVRPYKPEMKIREFETYQAVYCGLCKQLGRTFGQLSRFTLNYDFTLLAILSIALGAEQPDYCRERCIAHPLRKRSCCHLNDSSDRLTFPAGAAVLMLYYKAKDNLADSPLPKKLFWLLLLPYFSILRRQALPKFAQADKCLHTMIQRQQCLEKAACANVDEAAEPTANALSEMFKALSEEPVQRRVLAQLGYQLGRWIYFMDALDDIHEDFKNKGYNPFIQKQKKLFDSLTEKELEQKGIPDQVLLDAIGTLNMTSAQIAITYELLEVQRLRPILDNIIYLGLRESMKSVLRKQNREEAVDRLLNDALSPGSDSQLEM